MKLPFLNGEEKHLQPNKQQKGTGCGNGRPSLSLDVWYGPALSQPRASFSETRTNSHSNVHGYQNSNEN